MRHSAIAVLDGITRQLRGCGFALAGAGGRARGRTRRRVLVAGGAEPAGGVLVIEAHPSPGLIARFQLLVVAQIELRPGIEAETAVRCFEQGPPISRLLEGAPSTWASRLWARGETPTPAGLVRRIRLEAWPLRGGRDDGSLEDTVLETILHWHVGPRSPVLASKRFDPA